MLSNSFLKFYNGGACISEGIVCSVTVETCIPSGLIGYVMQKFVIPEIARSVIQKHVDPY